MSHPELLKKFTKPGVQGSPCRGVGCPHLPLFFLSARRLRRREKEKTCVGTPHTPAEGWPPSALPLAQEV